MPDDAWTDVDTGQQPKYIPGFDRDPSRTLRCLHKLTEGYTTYPCTRPARHPGRHGHMFAGMVIAAWPGTHYPTEEDTR